MFPSQINFKNEVFLKKVKSKVETRNEQKSLLHGLSNTLRKTSANKPTGDSRL